MDEEQMKAAVKAAEDKAAEVEAAKVAAEKELTDTKELLRKEKEKDKNFAKFRDLNEAEKAKLTEKERELLMRADEMEEKQKQIDANQRDFFRKSAIARVANGNEEVAKAVEAAYSEFSGDAADQASIEARVLKAARLVSGEKAVPETVMAAFSQVAVAPQAQETKKGFGESEDGKAFAQRMGLMIEKPAKN